VFAFGDWSDLSRGVNSGDEFGWSQNRFALIANGQQLVSQKFDFIFGSDILYETSNYESLLGVFDRFLAESGIVLIVSKMFYYGNGGGVYEFTDFCEKDGRFVVSTVAELNDKIGGNQRLILKLDRKN
jgi:hypothetical protein